MKNFLKALLFAGVLPALLLTGCKEDNTETLPQQSEFETLLQYMTQNNLDLSNLLNGWVVPASSLNANAEFAIPDYYVIDLRSQADFDIGHIKDAHLTTIQNVLNEAKNANGKKILVVCYTGQTAARAVAGLRLMGYDAVSLKWGMSAWHSDLAGKWNANAVNFSSPNWLTTGAPEVNQKFNNPVFATGSTDGALILKARVEYMLNKSNWTITKTDALATPENYFINNKWPLADFEKYGHIKGAFRIDEDLNLANLNYLNPTKPIVTYCYTGQTSSITNAWLDVLGYDTRSLMFGANGIVYDQLLVGSPKVTWKGTGSASVNNLGYYDGNNALHGPL